MRLYSLPIPYSLLMLSITELKSVRSTFMQIAACTLTLLIPISGACVVVPINAWCYATVIYSNKVHQNFATGHDGTDKVLEKTEDIHWEVVLVNIETPPSDSARAEVHTGKLPGPVKKLERDMQRIPGGSFIMGCMDAERDGECVNDEKPSRTVRVPDFSIGRYEVTQAQWRAVMGSDPPELYHKGCDECPVERVSWDDIQEFLKKLNALTGKRYRLPTESEWEYAARGGAQSKGYLYSGSNTIDEVAWYNHNSGSKTRPVGRKKPNELGLYDMSGNVWEWCEDDWHSDYNGAPTNGRAWVGSPRSSFRVYRGGGWGYDPRHCRASNRYFSMLTDRYYIAGFRLAL
ncbi:MAG: formylglycine-generating enzyme family protein [Saprospiraceae bacterium]|nr:formylglycine-generating enzyme family protein [Saprospiraceae bacterium]